METKNSLIGSKPNYSFFALVLVGTLALSLMLVPGVALALGPDAKVKFEGHGGTAVFFTPALGAPFSPPFPFAFAGMDAYRVTDFESEDTVYQGVPPVTPFDLVVMYVWTSNQFEDPTAVAIPIIIFVDDPAAAAIIPEVFPDAILVPNSSSDLSVTVSDIDFDGDDDVTVVLDPDGPLGPSGPVSVMAYFGSNEEVSLENAPPSGLIGSELKTTVKGFAGEATGAVIAFGPAPVATGGALDAVVVEEIKLEMKGVLTCDGSSPITGNVSGDVLVPFGKACTITATGSVNGNVEVWGDLQVLGIVNGNIDGASKITLDGATINGNIRHTGVGPGVVFENNAASVNGNIEAFGIGQQVDILSGSGHTVNGNIVCASPTGADAADWDGEPGKVTGKLDGC